MYKRGQLVVLAAVAAALVVAVIADMRCGGDEGYASRRLLPGYAAAGGVARIRWERPGEDPVVLERAAGGELVLSSHPRAVVDTAAARDVLGTLELLSYVRRERGGRDIASERGLLPPRVTLRVLMANGREHVIDLGDRIAEIDRVWVRVWAALGTGRGQGEDVELAQVYLIDGYAARSLDRSADDLRMRRVFALPAERIDAVALRAGEQALVLSGRPPRVQVTADGESGAVLADAAAYAALVEQLRELVIARFVSGAGPRRDAQSPERLRIRVRAGDQTLELLERGPCEDAPSMRLVDTSVGTGCMAAEPLDALRARAGDSDAMLARAVLAGEPVSELVLTPAPGADAIHLRARGQAWSRVDAKDGWEVESTAVERWLRDLARSSAGRYVPRPDAAAPGEPAGQPVLQIDATYQNGQRQRIVFFAHGTHGLMACRDREPLCLILDQEPSASRVLPVFAYRFRRRQLLSLEPYGLRQAVLERGGKTVAHLVRGALLDDWQARVPEGRSPVPRVVDTLRELGRLRARAFVAAAPAPAHGLTPPRARVEVAFDPGPLDEDASLRRHVLELGARTRRGCMARLDGAGPVLELDGSVCDVLMGEWTHTAAP